MNTFVQRPTHRFDKNKLAMSSPSEIQKALLLPAKAADYVIRTVPVPRPSPGQVMVKIHAAALGPLDWKMRETGLFINTYLIILGSNIAGTVEELGEGVEDFLGRVGDVYADAVAGDGGDFVEGLARGESGGHGCCWLGGGVFVEFCFSSLLCSLSIGTEALGNVK